jgi:cytidylate kinase
VTANKSNANPSTANPSMANPSTAIPVVTIDGPSGSGKGTVSRAVAKALGWSLLDSGALYRLVALAGRQAGVPLDDAPALARLAEGFDIRFDAGPQGEEIVRLAGRDVTRDIRTEEAGNDASKVAALPAVRTALLQRQRRFAVPPGLVADGRDMGTVVFPAAQVKIFLTASPAERAQRRHKQLKEKGVTATLAALSLEIAERDKRDITRSASPLVASADAVLLDTTGMSIDAVVERVLSVARERLALGV